MRKRLICATGLFLITSSAQAAMQDASTFKNLVFTQTSSNVTFTSAFFNASITSQNPGDFTSASLTLPDLSVQTLPQTDPKDFGIGPGFATQADMDAAYPMGTYVLSADGPSGPQSATLDYSQDAYAGNVGRLDGATYTALQGLNVAAGPLNVAFNQQDPAGAATATFTFFTIFGSDQDCGFMAPTAMGCVIDPSHLTAGTTYTYQLDFSNRIEQTVDNVLQGVDFDVRTVGTFTTAAANSPVPEAPTWATMLIGFGALGAGLRHRRRAVAVSG